MSSIRNPAINRRSAWPAVSLAAKWATMGTILLAATPHAAAGPFAPAAGLPGSTAIAKSSPLILNWANKVLSYAPGASVDAVWKTPEKALGPAEGTFDSIACLGNGGSITLAFPHPIHNGQGPDFAVFENGLNDHFLELAFVDVSSDGATFFRFPTVSLTTDFVGPFDAYGMDPTDLDGFAGKYRAGFGTPFDLDALPHSPLLDKSAIRFIRITDIIGDGLTLDSRHQPVYDPTPVIGSAGFDLDAIAVLHQNTAAPTISRIETTTSALTLTWSSNPGSTYQIEQSSNLLDWTPIDSLPGHPGAHTTQHTLSLPTQTQLYWRVARISPP